MPNGAPPRLSFPSASSALAVAVAVADAVVDAVRVSLSHALPAQRPAPVIRDEVRLLGHLDRDE